MILVAWLIVFLSGVITAIMRSRERNKLRGEAGHEYNNTQALNAVNYEVPLGPAPAYSTTNQDVHNDAPYALNPHPIPRAAVDDYQTQKHASYNNPGVYSSNNQNQTPYHNEKTSGFI